MRKSLSRSAFQSGGTIKPKSFASRCCKKRRRTSRTSTPRTTSSRARFRSRTSLRSESAKSGTTTGRSTRSSPFRTLITTDRPWRRWTLKAKPTTGRPRSKRYIRAGSRSLLRLWHRALTRFSLAGSSRRHAAFRFPSFGRLQARFLFHSSGNTIGSRASPFKMQAGYLAR